MSGAIGRQAAIVGDGRRWAAGLSREDIQRVDWRTLTVSKASPIPRYYQLAELVRERIRAGELAPGDQLPAERELAEYVGISRMTARQAVGYLVRNGALVVKPGIGTFVAAPKLTYDALHLLGFTEETVRHGDRVASRVLEQAVVVAPDAVAAALELPRGASAIKVVRLRAAGETPLLLEMSYLSPMLCAGLEHEDLASHSLYTLLELRYGVRLDRARQVIESSTANDYESDLLQIAVGAPLLLLEGVTYSEDERPVEWFRAVYRADRVKLALESRRETDGLNGASRMSVLLA